MSMQLAKMVVDLEEQVEALRVAIKDVLLIASAEVQECSCAERIRDICDEVLDPKDE